MEILQIKTPAKINIGLNIIEKRKDGFHNIESIFYPINLYDILTFKEAESFSFFSNYKQLNNNDNIVVKSVKILQMKTKKEIKLKINLKKNIPFGAGLGGGSSNAAAVLKSINNIYNLNLNDDDLFNIALSLGSDVPFFLNPIPCFVHSRGEICERINLKIKKPILIVNPGIHVSTKWAYENIRLKKVKVNFREKINESSDFKLLKEDIVNDFEDIVFRKFPEIKNLKNNLYKLGAEFSLMTGSGSTVFGIFPNLEKAEYAKNFFSNYFTFIHYEK